MIERIFKNYLTSILSLVPMGIGISMYFVDMKIEVGRFDPLIYFGLTLVLLHSKDRILKAVGTHIISNLSKIKNILGKKDDEV